VNRSEIEVTLGDGAVTIRRPGRTVSIVANVLGVDRGPGGEVIRVWLDRLIHHPGEAWEGAWSVWGAVSSVLERRSVPAPAIR
jgi:hypothetical protein